MEKFYILLFMLSSFSCSLHAENNLRSSKNALCKQKAAPISAVWETNSGQNIVKLTSKRDLVNFSLVDVRGLDEMKVKSYSELNKNVLSSGEEVEVQVEIEDRTGLHYLVLDIEYELNNKRLKNSITVSIGQLSREQITKRRRSIKDISSGRRSQSDINSNKPETKKKIHLMKME